MTYLRYNLFASLAFLGTGLYFVWDALLGDGDFLSDVFGAVFTAVGAARLGLVVWAWRRERRAAASG